MPAVAIVKRVENGRYSYELDEEALKQILTPKIKNMKVAVISVAGAFRKGKSFLLNFFVLYLNSLKKSSSRTSNEWFTDGTQLDCFPWRGGSTADTNGILMWSEPFILRDKDGDEVAVLLMDTQGTFDTNATVAECATIFALSTMISSLQIYNISSDIQEDYLQHLRLFIEYGSLALKETNKKPFQTLLFLIRDWAKDYEHEYGFGGGEEYLRETLKKTQTQKPELRELRNKIGSNFERLLCFLLPHPGLEIARSRDLKNIGQISETFKEYILQLVPSLFSSKYLVTKEINGQKITTGELMHYIKAYMDVFNSDTLPEPMTVLQATGEANHTMAATAAKAYYETEMQPVLDPSFTDELLLLEMHDAAKANAVRKFENTQKMGGEELTKKHRQILIDNMKTRCGEFATAVREKARLAKEKEKQIREREENERVARLERERLIKERQEAEAERRRANEELERRRVEQARQAALAQEQLRRDGERQQAQLEEQRRQVQRNIEEQRQMQRNMEEQERRRRIEQERLAQVAQEQQRRERERHQEQLQEQARQMQRNIAEQERRAAEEAQRIAQQQARLNEEMRAFAAQREQAQREEQAKIERANQKGQVRIRGRIVRCEEPRRNNPINEAVNLAGEVLAAPFVITRGVVGGITSLFRPGN